MLISVPCQEPVLLLALIAVAMELAAASHFRGAIIQWRPVDPDNFDGRVSEARFIWIIADEYCL